MQMHINVVSYLQVSGIQLNIERVKHNLLLCFFRLVFMITHDFLQIQSPVCAAGDYFLSIFSHPPLSSMV